MPENSLTASGPSGSRLIRFGPFEADVHTQELRKHGARLRIPGQSFQVLQMLLARPGNLVTREELQKALWPSDTFVDYDHSLNAAMNKLRDALGDSASNPRYVETLARRGYRFLAPVQRDGAAPLTDSTTPAPTVAPLAALHRELDVPRPNRGLIRALFGLIQLMYLIFYVAALFRLTEIDRITSAFLPGWGAFAIFAAVLITAGVGIPLRFYLLSAVAFDHQRTGEKFQRIFLAILVIDQFWAIAPFLMINKIGFGAAFAAAAALLYVPFSERTLVRLAYPSQPQASPNDVAHQSR